MKSEFKKIPILAVLFFYLFILVQAGFAQYSPYYKPVRSGSYIQDKAYYLLTCFDQLPGVKESLLKDPKLESIYSEKMKYISSIKKRIENAQSAGEIKNLDVSVFKKLHISVDDIAEHLKFSDQQISTVASLLEKYDQEKQAMNQLVQEHLRPSGKFELYIEEKNPEYLKTAWELTAKGLNHVIDVYALGKDAEYAYIDSASFDVKSGFYQGLVSSVIMNIGEKSGERELFFEPSLQFVLGLLKINHRNEAARFEPLETGENYKAYQHIPNISWRDYPYSVILVPGEGTVNYKEEMNPMGKLRCDLAAQKFKEKKAPLIIVSGGFVHPIQTKHAEAFEMKKYLMKEYSIPEEDIIIEPFARHTTTNFRNAVRLMYSYNIPTDKKAIVVTTAGQSYYITNMGLTERCKRDLGYVPYRSLKRLSVSVVEFIPDIKAMQSDPAQPLDP